MKNILILLVILFAIGSILAQDGTFTDADASDSDWSNTGNWDGSTLPGTTGKAFTNNSTAPNLDSDAEVAKFCGSPSESSGGSNGPLSGSATLTLNGNGVTEIFRVRPWNDGTFHVYPTINITSTDENELIVCHTGADNHANHHLVFNGDLILDCPKVSFETQNGRDITINGIISGSGEINVNNTSVVIFNGSLESSGIMYLSDESHSTFTGDADNSLFTGSTIETYGNSQLTSEITGGNLFLPPGTTLQKVGGGGITTCTIEGANSIEGDFWVNFNRNLTLNFNADQSSMGTLYLGGDANFNLNLGTDVQVEFADCSGTSWGEGSSLNITNFSENAIRFGQDVSGLTEAQLGLIIHDGSGGSLTLDENGWLVYDIPLGIEDLDFRGIEMDGNHILSWQISGRHDLSSFEIQQSYDGDVFNTIGTVKVKTFNEREGEGYRYEVMKPLAGSHYYRLNILNQDGIKNQSHILQLDARNQLKLNVYPNPVNIRLYIRSVRAGECRVFNCHGHLLKTFTIIEGYNETDFIPFASGIYFLQLEGEKAIQFLKN